MADAAIQGIYAIHARQFTPRISESPYHSEGMGFIRFLGIPVLF